MPPTADHQTDPPPSTTKREFLAVAIIPPEKEVRPAQSDDIKKGTSDQQSTQSDSIQQKESRRSTGKGHKSVRDHKYADIKPIMLRNREKGQKTRGTAIYKYLQRHYDHRFEGQLRTTQRIVRELIRELAEEQRQRIEQPHQPFPEIFIPQDHHPGEVAQLDCTSLASLGITINCRPLKGKIFTFKLMYSKWVYASIVPSETEIEVLSAIQAALWTLNGVPKRLRSDNGRALFRKKKVPTEAYNELCSHYGTPCSAINPGHPNENGGAETCNKTVKGLLRDRLTTDTDSDFASEDALKGLLREVVDECNAGVQPKLTEERGHLARLPSKRVEPYDQLERKVNKEGMIQHDGCKYSVPPEVHGTKVEIRRYSDHLVIYNGAGEPIWRWPLASDARFQVEFGHVIHWLEKKLGALKDCQYRDQLYPTERFRAAHKKLEQWYAPDAAAKNYLAILAMAVGPHPIRQGDDHLIREVDCALELLLEGEARFMASDVAGLVDTRKEPLSKRELPSDIQMQLPLQ